ncbi:MAG TPA: ATP-dependent Clp protease proteolytic subunit [Candidatus Fimousia stercorigallinarum]|nr:ATP-dependent Clp protease proteolytic subunit [Candidatus Fimousia stercorigallinarum]
MNILIRSSSGITQVPVETKLLSERRIFIEGEITANTAMEFVKQLLYLNIESEETITVFINSPGGEINSGLLMYDAIVGSKAPVRTICMGKAYSMGAVLFTCAKERFMLPNSELMLHQPLLGGRVSGNASSIRSISDSLLETKRKLNKLIAIHTGKTEKEIDEATGFDHYYSPDEAVDFHLADKIICFSEMEELI